MIQPSTYKSSSKKKILFIGLFVIAIGALAYLFFFRKSKQHEDNQAYAKYIEAYTSGTVSKKSFIRVHLSNPVQGMQDIGKEESRDLFDFSPSVSGKAYWIDAQTIEFRPEENLKSGKEYEVTFNIGKIMPTEKGLEEFEFSFKVLKPGLMLSQEGIVSQNNTSLDYMKLTGEVATADAESTEQIEKIIKIDFDQKLKVKWQHNPAENTSKFVIDSIKKTNEDQVLKLSWDGEDMDAEQKGVEEIRVPAMGKFEVLAIKAIQGQEDYGLVQFSEPLDFGQDLRGLLALGTLSDLRYTIDGSQVKIYSADKLNGNYTLSVYEGVESISGNKLTTGKKANLTFEEKEPSVTIAGSGSILPNSDKLVLPFEAINLKAVDVTVIKIYESSIPQFFQVNSYKDGNELRRVAKPILQKTIRLDEDKSLNLRKKNRFTLDLEKLIKTEPGAMYRITIAFKLPYNVYNCKMESSTSEDGESDYEVYSYGEKIDEDDDFWKEYNNYYPSNYNWQDRDNPCSPSFYTSQKWVSRNLISSNIGLIAKRGNDNNMLVAATDLLSARPLSGVTLDFMNYQNQLIFSTKTDENGLASFDLKQKPFLLIAKNGAEKGYLKLDDGTSLPLSRFDVGGELVQNGVKGFIYGERGVWRPGDSLHLSFILEDKLKKLPVNYPATMELYNPKGQLYTRLVNNKPLNNFYTFTATTESTSPTGNWLAKVKVGGNTFSKTLKIETVMPNRLKIDFSVGNNQSINQETKSAILSAKWLFGAVAQNLKAKVDVNLNTVKTEFKGFGNYSFDNPTVQFESQVKTIFEGTLNANGSALVNTQLNENSAPGMLRANFSIKVFEPGGNFSIDNFSLPYHLYTNYLGVKTDNGDKLSGMLLTNENHPVDIVNVNTDGKLLMGSKTVVIELYKTQWRWWWEQDDQDTYANFSQNSYNKLIKSQEINLRNGKGKWNLNVKDWGRYLILVRDLNGGHVTGKSVYLDSYDWMKRESSQNPTEAAMLSFTANKEKFQIGDDITLTIPSGKNGRALISIENGSRVLKTFWTNTKEGQTQFTFKAEKNMAPNVFANITLLQPHAQTVNDLPIRMYGAIPLLIEDQQTQLQPAIRMVDKMKPETENTVTVSEKSGKAMTYTIALVDEGLLDLTRFKTPNPHAAFYAKESLGVKTWDLYDYVLGAWGGNMDRIFSIGGDGTVNKNLNPAKANRFQAVVKFMGPFSLAKGESKAHKFKLPQYIGAIRAMVIAGGNGAYGNAEKTVQVKKPLMVLATLPRVMGPGESFTLPTTVFTTENNLKNVSLRVETTNLSVQGSNQQQLYFKKTGEQQAYFQVQAPQRIGIAKVKVIAKSGSEQAVYEVEMDIRNPNPYITKVISTVVEPQQNWQSSYSIIGMPGTSSGSLEVSSIPGINLGKRLNYLIQYPHGCIEQTTSGVFPQLYLSQLMPLTETQKMQTEKNIKAGILKLKDFQTVDGGFAYWPGSSTSDEWGTNYGGHFLVEAANAGYTLPVGLMDNVLRFEKAKANTWVPNSQNFYGGDLLQAYRLYILALAKKPEIAAMNRLKEFAYLSIPAKWRLSAAYKLAGQNDVAQKMVANLSTEIKPYNQLGGTFGSDLRDRAMILETLVLLGQKAKANALLQNVAARLGQEDWYSTQTTAYALLSVAKFCGVNKGGKNLNYQYFLDGKSVNVSSTDFMNSTAINFKGNNVSVSNKGNSILFVRLVLSGQPLSGEEIHTQNDPNILYMNVVYKRLNGQVIDPSIIKQGTDFFAEVTIKNPGQLGYYEQMALTQIFPSGWEIINTRLSENEGILGSSPATYQDIRDDRVFTYFNLRENETVTYKVLLNASYIGKYYLGATQCEAMYDHKITATKPGKWVQVIK
ncbi:alpha-2-macroglobulin family protein [Pedobacter sp. MW01-1-1]|uniref:alpha-2-macroglobulin family protein n=1 Tax=Pedobacter sp. MW01-1-1 TaxID=3383027 RepID=UPI003FEFC814